MQKERTKRERGKAVYQKPPNREPAKGACHKSTRPSKEQIARKKLDNCRPRSKPLDKKN